MQGGATGAVRHPLESGGASGAGEGRRGSGGETGRCKGAFPVLQSHQQEQVQDCASHQMQVTEMRRKPLDCDAFQGGARTGVSAGGAASLPPGELVAKC